MESTPTLRESAGHERRADLEREPVLDPVSDGHHGSDAPPVEPAACVPPTEVKRAPTASAPRSTTLDVLRAVAVILVLGRHVLDPVTGLPGTVSLALTAWRSFGWIGVDLFFVLSGFLVSGLLFREYQKHGALGPGRFLLRRGFKIYPGFYLLLAVTWLWLGKKLPAISFLYEGLFVQNYFGMVWNHTWSLAVEEHFYFALALGLWLVCRRAKAPDPFRWLPAFTGAVAVAVLALRAFTFMQTPTADLLLPTHLRVDALLFGVLLSYGWAWHRERLVSFVDRYRVSLAAVSLALLLPSVLRPLEGDFVVNVIGLTTNFLGFGGLLLLAVVAGERGATSPALKPLARIGYYSYSIYLWHMPMWVLMRNLFERRQGHAVVVAAYFASSLVVGTLIALILELPILKLRDRLLPSRAR
jgi:peptidoglycan/LPS O-acetylase OafA/YrhL